MGSALFQGAIAASMLLTPGAPGWNTVYQATLNADGGALSGKVQRMVFATAGQLAAGNRVRVTFEAGVGEGLDITSAYIGYRSLATSADAYDFMWAPIPLTFNGGSASVNIGVGAMAVSDEIPFFIDNTKDIIIAFHCGNTGADTARIGVFTGLNLNASGYSKTTAVVNQINEDTYSTSSDLVGINLVEAMDTGVPEFLTAVDLGIGGPNGGWGGYTLRTNIPANHVVVPGSQVKATFRSGNDPVTILAAYIGVRAGAGDAYDFASAPTQLLFGGSAGVVAGGAQAEVTSDATNFTVTGTDELIVAVAVNTGNIYGVVPTNATGGISGRWKAGNDAATQDATGYSAAGNAYVFRKLEVLN